MNRRIIGKYLALALILCAMTGGKAFSRNNYLTDLNALYGAGYSCDICHPYTVNYGADFLAEYTANGGSTTQAFQSIENLDSDGDGFINIDEINAATNPSDAASVPGPPSNTAPTVSIDSPASSEYHCAALPLQYSVSNGAVEILLDGSPISRPSGSALTGLANGNHTLTIQATDSAGNTGSAEVNFSVHGDFIVPVADTDGNSADELAVLNSDSTGQIKAVMKDSANRNWVNSVNFPDGFAFVAMASIADVDGNTAPELAVLGIDAAGAVKVILKDSASRAWVSTLIYPDTFVPVSLAGIADVNSNGSPEVVVVGIDENGQAKAIIKDADNGQWVAALDFQENFTPVAAAVVPDLSGNAAPELAVLGVDANSLTKVILKDTAENSWVNTIKFPGGFSATALTAVADMNGNGSPELAVLGRTGNGKVKAIVKDSASSVWISTVMFPNDIEPAALTVLGDLNGNGSPELVALGVEGNGQVKSIIKDATSRNWVTTVKFAGSTSAPSGKSIYDTSCAACHALNGYDSSGAPDLAAKGELVAGKFSTSHNGNTLTSSEQAAIAWLLDQYTAPPVADCTACHGQPPSGSASPNTAGAHQVHGGLADVGTDCSTCHGGASHNGTVDQNIATVFSSKNATAAANSDQTCSGISCHGGQTTPNWVSGSINVATQCKSCHESGTGQFNSYSSGQHNRHAVNYGYSCQTCHDTGILAVGHFEDLSTSAFEQDPATTVKGSLSYNGRTCQTPGCHGSKNW